MTVFISLGFLIPSQRSLNAKKLDFGFSSQIWDINIPTGLKRLKTNVGSEGGGRVLVGNKCFKN